VIKSFLRDSLEREGFGFGFLTGGVTFCAMLPCGGIPFKVICLVGMNDNAYPRQTISPGFDLVVKSPKPGDRSRRNDDRYLFLESILSARERVYISYVGRASRTTALIPPSVLVSELTDYIEQGFEILEGKVLDHVITNIVSRPSAWSISRKGTSSSATRQKTSMPRDLLPVPAKNRVHSSCQDFLNQGKSGRQSISTSSAFFTLIRPSFFSTSA